MLSRSEDVEVHALSKRGWSISAIARHLECDRCDDEIREVAVGA